MVADVAELAEQGSSAITVKNAPEMRSRGFGHRHRDNATAAQFISPRI